MIITTTIKRKNRRSSIVPPGYYLIRIHPFSSTIQSFSFILTLIAPDALSSTVEGHSIFHETMADMTWHIDAKKCAAFWTSNGACCSNCIRTCPFNRAFVWLDDLFGYGKKKDSDQFWKV